MSDTPLDELISYIRQRAESRRIAILSVKESRMLIAAIDGALESDPDDPDEALWPPRPNNQLRQALKPFASGGKWGRIKAFVVNGAGDRIEGAQLAAQITAWQVAVDAALKGGL